MNGYKNHCVEAPWDPAAHVNISSPDVEGENINGEISAAIIGESHAWFSFGGSPLGEAATLNLVGRNGEIFAIANSHDLVSLKCLLPQYEASPKHRKQAYTSATGEHVSPMPLNEVEAQNILLTAIASSDDLIGFHEGRNKYFRFKVTRNNIYHGFEVEEDDVAQHIRDELLRY